MNRATFTGSSIWSEAQERGAKVATNATGLCTIDDLPVIVDSRIDVEALYVVSHSGGAFWDA
jgi:hypothetical protein